MTKPTFYVDDVGVRRELADGKVEQVTWDSVFFVLAGASGAGCVVPQGAPESDQLLERLQRLPGFDNGAVIRAMSCATDERFLCWRRRPTP